MSRGPGQLQRRVLETLAQYETLGKCLGWKWIIRSRYSHANYADDYDVGAYESGRYVPMWMLLRDLGCRKDDLSRAIKGLERQGLAYRLGGDLEGVLDPYGLGKRCKFLTITKEGSGWLKRQQRNSSKVGAYVGGAA